MAVKKSSKKSSKKASKKKASKKSSRSTSYGSLSASEEMDSMSQAPEDVYTPPAYSAEEPKEEKKPNWFAIAGLVVVVLIAIFFLVNRSKKNAPPPATGNQSGTVKPPADQKSEVKSEVKPETKPQSNFPTEYKVGKGDLSIVIAKKLLPKATPAVQKKYAEDLLKLNHITDKQIKVGATVKLPPAP